MKLLTIILSVYILGLNFIPCDDAENSVDQETVSVGLDADQEQHNGNGADECAPFCQCHCCHIHVAQFNTQGFEVLEPVISTLIIKKGENTGQDIPHPHFQPPRI